MNMLFAQVTGTFEDGSSNAEDFQPQTRNPQTAPGNLQTPIGPQSTGVQEILNDSNVRIIVPKVEPAKPVPVPPSGGLNFFAIFAVVIISAIIVVLIENYFRKRDSQKDSVTKAKPSTSIVEPETEESDISELEAKVKAELDVTSGQETPKKEKKKKKSKSKRKNR